MKNGADIRLAIDVIEDLFRVPDLTHVVIVAGDSDYIALAQRSKRLGRYVVGIGVAGATSASLAAACDEFMDYDALPGTAEDSLVEEPPAPVVERAPKTRTRAARTTEDKAASNDAPEPAAPSRAPEQTGTTEAPAASQGETTDSGVPIPKRGPSGLLVRALRLGHAKDDAEWLGTGAVKNHMLRMDPTFNEKALGYRTFTEFLRSRGSFVEVDETGTARKVKLRAAFHP